MDYVSTFWLFTTWIFDAPPVLTINREVGEQATPVVGILTMLRILFIKRETLFQNCLTCLSIICFMSGSKLSFLRIVFLQLLLRFDGLLKELTHPSFLHL
jgi:hypothetical protein